MDPTSFDYTMNGQTYNSGSDKYISIPNTDDVTVTVGDGTYIVSYSNGDTFVEENLAANGSLTIPGTLLENYTGIVIVKISDGTSIGTIHVMLVGPVVHSGLEPSAASY